MECDNGVFRPNGFRFQGSAAGLAYVLFQVPVMVAVHAGEMLTIRPES